MGTIPKLIVLFISGSLFVSCSETPDPKRVVLCVESTHKDGCSGALAFPSESKIHVANGQTIGVKLSGFGKNGAQGLDNQYQVEARFWDAPRIVKCAFIVDGNKLGERRYDCGDNVPSVTVRVEVD